MLVATDTEVSLLALYMPEQMCRCLSAHRCSNGGGGGLQPPHDFETA